MARTDLHFVHDPMQPATNHVQAADSRSPPYISENGPSICSKNSSSPFSRWGSFRDDSQRPIRLGRKPSDPKYSRLSLDNSEARPLEGVKRISLRSRRTNTDPYDQQQPWSPVSRRSFDIDPIYDSHDGLPRKARSVRTKVNIKPLLRKISGDGGRSASLDLSRSSVEYEGLGIYTNLDHERHHSGYFGKYTARRTASGLHDRSLSGFPQSPTVNSSTLSKRNSTNAHPMRQEPSAYTPPLSRSYQTSSDESDDIGNEGPSLPERESSTLAHSDSIHPIRPPRLSLQTHDIPFTKSTGLPQSSVTSRHSFGYSRDPDSSAVDSPSPISRASLDFVFRPKQRVATDPISRAATVQAARKAFDEKEAAKAQKLEKHQMKSEERHMRRKEKQQWWRSSADNQSEKTDVENNTDLGSNASERSISPEAPGNSPGHSPSQHSPGPIGGGDDDDDDDGNNSAPPPLPPQTRTGSWKSQSKNTWMLFMTWLRTRLFKLRRRLRKLH